METKQCSGCKEIKSLDQFYVKRRNKGDGRTPRCKECMNAYRKGRPEYYSARHREWVERNRDHVRAYNEAYKDRAAELREINREKLRRQARERARRIHQEAINAYGGFCACCGETEMMFLQIDHVNNDGAEHRRSIKGYRLGDWLKQRGYPEGFQVLCANCNFAKSRTGGSCPHQMAMDEAIK